MLLNALEIIDRNNRPNLSSRTALRVFFFNDGQLADPYAISAVTVFQKTANISPNSVLDTSGLIAATVVSTDIKGHFGVSSSTDYSNSAIAESNYHRGASGVYRVGTGEYICVLDNTDNVSSIYELNGSSLFVDSSAANVATDYIDIWTVQLLASSDWKTLINNFTLFSDTFYTTTEPLLLKSSPKLHTKHITLGSKADLKISTSITVSNRSLTEDIKNIFKHNVIANPKIKIQKLNEESTLPARVDVSGFSDTSALIDVTSGNTLVFNWDPENSTTLSSWADGTFGSLTGAYQITVKYDLLGEVYVSPPFTVIVS